MYFTAAQQTTEGQRQGLARLYKVFADAQLSGFHPGDSYNRTVDCDEVYPGIFIGDDNSARKKDTLVHLGITHVLNSAEGREFGQVDTGPQFYRDVGIAYRGFDLMDLPHVRICQHFEAGANFIDLALQRGKVLVHCLMGMSRSATMVLAYLILKKGMTTEEALRTILRRRAVRPNDGFLLQLLELEQKMKDSKRK
ncbi:DUSP3 [Cordylochernes scorpioides]|uniref:Dual specificity protein phosphatase n=1 Tax=Cordylochernes scorpioides TaxID=51811 RepID=A0ABY6LH24_9ARAC|nr:DUSP3 [Cordylochernes scorpioides]UYV80477.1 DUSP3 [Cordylochernes scorpioides]